MKEGCRKGRGEGGGVPGGLRKRETAWAHWGKIFTQKESPVGPMAYIFLQRFLFKNGYRGSSDGFNILQY